jgi:cytochrome b561
MTTAGLSGFVQGPSYTPVAKALHWTTAVLVLTTLPLGFVMANYDVGDTLYNLHKSIGPLILIITLVRLAYRLTHRPPPLPADMMAIEKFGAHASHWGLYALLIVQPLVGWVATSAYPAPVPFFGLFDLPAIWHEDKPLSEMLYFWHKWIGVALVLLICAHVGAALFHYFVHKDGILQRMLRA